jgi:hypothetical protein
VKPLPSHKSHRIRIFVFAVYTNGMSMESFDFNPRLLYKDHPYPVSTGSDRCSSRGSVESMTARAF